MDDQRFDDIIKGKVGEYTDPTLDAGAIAGLHQHLAGYQVVPWYTPYKSAGLIAATLAIFTLINWALIRNGATNSNTSNEPLNSEYTGLIAELKDEINRLQSIEADTVFIVNTISQPPGTLTASVETSPDLIINEFLQRIKEERKIGRIGGYYFYHEDDVPNYGEFIALNSRETDLDGSYLSISYPVQDTIYKDGYVELVSEERSKMPVMVVRDLEKHYSRGLGLKIGGELELAVSNPDLGNGEALPGVGLLAELVFSPSLALETGIKYKTRSYTINDPNADVLSAYPDASNTSNPINQIEGDAKLFEIPLNAKLYRTVSQNKDFYFSLGVSPNLYLSQSFEYSQPSNNSNTDSDIKITSEEDVDGSKFYLGTINTGAGLAIGLPKKREVQLGLFYQKSLGGVGIEDRKMNVFGVKSSYWFRVR